MLPCLGLGKSFLAFPLGAHCLFTGSTILYESSGSKSSVKQLPPGKPEGMIESRKINWYLYSGSEEASLDLGKVLQSLGKWRAAAPKGGFRGKVIWKKP